MTKPAAFTQGDISKVLKGAIAAGLTVSSVTVDAAGKIVAQFGNPENDDRPGETDLDRIIRAQKEQASAQRDRVRGSARKLARPVQG
jgi:hypothetical protein